MKDDHRMREQRVVSLSLIPGFFLLVHLTFETVLFIPLRLFVQFLCSSLVGRRAPGVAFAIFHLALFLFPPLFDWGHGFFFLFLWRVPPGVATPWDDMLVVERVTDIEFLNRSGAVSSTTLFFWAVSGAWFGLFVAGFVFL